MKSLLKLFWILGVSLIALSFTACSDDDDDPKSAESALLEMKFDDDIVTVQPIITGTDIKFFVAYDATEEDLKEMVPAITVSNKATVNPASGSKVDFSGDPVKFTVTAEDGINKTVYSVSYQRIGKYDFEEWVEEGVANHFASGLKIPFYAPVGSWSSSNKGAALIISSGKATQVVVTKTDDAHSGNGAARIETILSNNIDGTGSSMYPVVTTGSLFLGSFSVSLNVLASTKFGIPYNKKTVAIKGYYKYLPGTDFYRSTEKSRNKVTLEENTTDKCAINAILYEIDDENSPYITGVDTYKFEKNEKLVAVAKLADGTAKAEYTAFQIDFKDKDGNTAYAYDPTKKYRMSIICSSSAEGDTFSGAPGSVLFVDDIEVISE
ncbi:MAG: PCMD domain-containing protein [Prevotella sp.]|jgi:hypothetical protein|nr:PCMD domain-containing protein [Prevotella sp.]